MDGSAPKRDKKVSFYEDPLGRDADPTTPALDQTTLHELAEQAKSGRSGSSGSLSEGKTEDFDAMFGDMKKKKSGKKKKLIPMDFDDAGSGTSTPIERTETPDLAQIPKAKSKTDLVEDSGTSTPVAKEVEDGATTAAVPDDFLADFKKKKSKKKKALADFEAELGEVQGDDVDGTHLDNLDEAELGEDVFANAGGETLPSSNEEPWQGSERDYAYVELLHRFYSQLHAQNPALLSSSSKKYSIAPPAIYRDGNKRTVFANVTDICKRMHRSPEHVIAFMFAEMGTTGSVDGSTRLVIKGRFQQKQVENILRKYIVEYVTCRTCRSPDTTLTKENRIFFVECGSCGSRRSVNAIKSGFQAQVGRRSKNKTA